jgi:hypothetical protein
MNQFVAALNAVCPYYTMFPLEFPLGVLARRSRPKQWVLDPFCGRGTTTFAARLLGLPSVGLDSNPLAAALAAAKLPSVSPRQVSATARYILHRHPEPGDVPSGGFWRSAYNPTTLRQLCRLRARAGISRSFWASRRPPGKARGARIPGVCKRRATQPGGMHRRPG